jgi:hypothetical protein
MPDRPSDEDVSRQILGVFVRHRLPAPERCNAIIFLKCATVISNVGSTRRSPTIGSPSICENRYRYQLTTTGYTVGRVIDPVLEA